MKSARACLAASCSYRAMRRRTAVEARGRVLDSRWNRRVPIRVLVDLHPVLRWVLCDSHLYVARFRHAGWREIPSFPYSCVHESPRPLCRALSEAAKGGHWVRRHADATLDSAVVKIGGSCGGDAGQWLRSWLRSPSVAWPGHLFMLRARLFLRPPRSCIRDERCLVRALNQGQRR